MDKEVLPQVGRAIYRIISEVKNPQKSRSDGAEGSRSDKEKDLKEGES